MLLTPFSCVLVRLIISLLVLRIGLVVMRVAIFSLSLAVWVGAAFALLRLGGVCRSKFLPLLLKFLLDLDSVSISHIQ
jgi:hypothetical protein